MTLLYNKIKQLNIYIYKNRVIAKQLIYRYRGYGILLIFWKAQTGSAVALKLAFNQKQKAHPNRSPARQIFLPVIM